MFTQVESERGNFEIQWQDIADMIVPYIEFTRTNAPGTKNNIRIFDDTAGKAADRLASSIFSTAINPAIKWFGLRTRNAAINDLPHVQSWLKFSTDHLFNIFNSPSSGFAMSAHQLLVDLTTFHTSIFMVLDSTSHTRFINRPLSECFLVENEDQVVNQVYRKFELKLHELKAHAEKSGWKLSDRTRIRINEADAHKMASEGVQILHYVYKREEIDPKRSDGPNKPWASIYIEKDQAHELHVSGFDRNPYKTPRWEKAAQEVYGRGPSMRMLPSIRGINVIKKTVLQAGEKAVSPPLLVAANSTEGPISTIPNSIIYYQSSFGGGNRDPITPLQSGDVRLGHEILESERQNIREGYFQDIFQLPERDRMTATEILERTQQKMTMMAPILARMTAEWLSPTIEDTFFYEMKHERLPPAPQEILDSGLTIEYFGSLAIAQQSSESNNILRTFNQATPLLSADPSAAQVFKVPEIIRALAIFNNMDPNNIRTSEEYNEIISQKQQQQQLVEGASAAKDAASAVKDVAQAEAI